VVDPHDFAHPRLGQPLDAINRYGLPIARRAISLEPGAIVVAAMKRSGLPELGTETISEPFEILCRSIEEEARLHSLGRYVARTSLVGLLTTRARAIDLVAKRPEIEAAPFAPPIVITGMPSSGTTFLQRLLARDVGLRHLPHWEATAPLPTGSVLERDAPTDDRHRRSVSSARRLDRVAPAMRSRHEIDPDEPDDDTWLSAVDLASMRFEGMWHVPAFAEWYDGADLTQGYHWLRRMLAILQWYRAADRWLLASPQHLERFDELTATFPGAVIVQTHRDPLSAVTATAAAITYGRRMSSSHVDPVTIGRYWTWRTGRMLERNLAQRERLRPTRLLDVRHDQLLADPMRVVRSIYALAERDLTGETAAAMEHHLAERAGRDDDPRTVDERPEHHGIDPAAVRREFADYFERFDVPTEP
jgi:hypothetical protein